MPEDNFSKQPSILKPGAKIVIKKVNMNDPGVKRGLEELRKKQKEIEARETIDWNSAKNIVINI